VDPEVKIIPNPTVETCSAHFHKHRLKTLCLCDRRLLYSQQNLPDIHNQPEQFQVVELTSSMKQFVGYSELPLLPNP